MVYTPSGKTTSRWELYSSLYISRWNNLTFYSILAVFNDAIFQNQLATVNGCYSNACTCMLWSGARLVQRIFKTATCISASMKGNEYFRWTLHRSFTEAQCGNYQQLSGGSGQPVCTMTIPNRLLLDWSSITFVSKANDHIANEIITLKHRLEKRLALLARKMKSKIQGASGRTKSYYKAVPLFMFHKGKFIYARCHPWEGIS